MEKPIIRTIHHLSCTGGTLISKCIASMPNTTLISEVHPFVVGKLRFNPFDPVQQLFSQNIITDKEEALKYVFKKRIEMAAHLTSLEKNNLILRDHTHSDYLTAKEPSGYKLKSLINTLKFDFHVKSVLTLRNPIDTFLSLEKNGWSGGVKTFDEYCRRIILMLDAYEGTPVYHYEEFCREPDAVLKDICSNLKIEFDSDYKNNYFNKKLTGDSGRGKQITDINPLPRREYCDDYLEEVEGSDYFQELRKRFGY